MELYHRERAISAVISEENRQSALRELQAAFEAEQRQRDIDLLASDNALKDAVLRDEWIANSGSGWSW